MDLGQGLCTVGADLIVHACKECDRWVNTILLNFASAIKIELRRMI